MKVFTRKQFCLTSITNEWDDLQCDETLPQPSEIRAHLLETQENLSSIDIEEWRRHTNRYDECSEVIKALDKTYHAELPTRAWLKMYEILCVFPQLTENKPLTSVHLCEAPGAFICALNHFLDEKGIAAEDWRWKATTLNPRYEWNKPNCTLFQDCRLLDSCPENWFFGDDNSGDILDESNRMSILSAMGDNAYLVTADGGIDCQDRPEEQEELTTPLILAEIECALKLLCVGGCLVLKTFTMFTSAMLGAAMELIANFKEVHLVKPTASRSGNSERYYVCIGRLAEPRVHKLERRLFQANAKLDIMQTEAIKLNLKRYAAHVDGWQSFCSVFALHFFRHIQLRKRSCKPLLSNSHFLQCKNYWRGSLNERREVLIVPNEEVLCSLFDLCFDDSTIRMEFQLDRMKKRLPTVITGRLQDEAPITLSAFVDQRVLDLLNRILSPDQLIHHQCKGCVPHLLKRRSVDRLRWMLCSCSVNISLACNRGCMRLKPSGTGQWEPDGLPINTVQFLKYPLERSFVETVKKINSLWAWTRASFHLKND